MSDEIKKPVRFKTLPQRIHESCTERPLWLLQRREYNGVTDEVPADKAPWVTVAVFLHPEELDSYVRGQRYRYPQDGENKEWRRWISHAQGKRFRGLMFAYESLRRRLALLLERQYESAGDGEVFSFCDQCLTAAIDELVTLAAIIGIPEVEYQPRDGAEYSTLMRFCYQAVDHEGDDEETATRGEERFGKPFNQGGFTWATDGRILVRVPEIWDLDPAPDAPWVVKGWDAFPKGEVNWSQLQLVGEVKGKVRIGHRWIDVRYTELIEDLPGVEVALDHGGELDPLPFRWDDGAGLVMPVKVLPEDEEEDPETARMRRLAEASTEGGAR